MVNDATDRIERQIDIDAPATRVWELISRPGWWINEGTIGDHPIDRDGDVNVIHHPKYGDFRIGTIALEPPRHAAFRWLSGENDSESSPEGGSTLVEFWIDDRDANDQSEGVTLRVVESGFASLHVSDEARRKNIDENTEGWEEELAAARAWVERHGAGQHGAGQQP